MRADAISALAFMVLAMTLIQVAEADEAFSVVINGRTGEAVLRNDGSSPVSLDGYLLRSPLADVFNPSSWDSLQDSAVPGWSESLATGNRFGEANLFSATSVAAGGTVNIGLPYMPFAPTAIGASEPGLGSINFTYSVAGMGAFSGDVEFVARNTVVVVDPLTGSASLENQSAFNINMDSYLIRSRTGVLDVEGWTPLEETLGAAGGWTASSGAANRVAEGNLLGSTLLAANGGRLPIGTLIDPDMLEDETDLELEFTVTGMSAIEGGVLFAAAVAPPAPPGDYNGNGTVDAADYVLWRNGGPLQNEGVTPNSVTADDYSFWRSRFGMTAGSGASAVAAAGVAVPEPSAGLLAVFLLTAVGVRTRQHIRAYSG